MDVYVRKRGRRFPVESIAALILGVVIGFVACYALFGGGSGGDTPETVPPVAMNEPQSPPAEEPQPVEDGSEPSTPTQQPGEDPLPAPEPPAPALDSSAPAEVAALEDVWPARHLFVAVNGVKLDSRTKELLAELKPGGVVLNRDNVQNKNQIMDLIAEIKAAVGLGSAIDSLPIIAAAQEGAAANVLRLKDAPATAKIGSAQDLAAAREAGTSVGKSAYDRGVGVLFAPSLDVVSEESWKDTQAKAFGSDPQVVSAVGLAYADGIRRAGVLPVVKHFPGIGSLKTDPSKAPAVLDADQEALSRLMLPFNDAATRNVPGILVANVAVPTVDGDSNPPPPASLSAKLVRGMLREKWGFDGVILADDVTKPAMTKTRSVEQAAVEALANGCDAVLMLDPDPEKVRLVCAAIEKAAADGVLDRARLSESKKRLDSWQQALASPAQGLTEPLPALPGAETTVAEAPEAPQQEPAPTETSAPSAEAAAPIEYTVVAGDGLAKIAGKFGVTVQQIKEWNDLKSDNLYVGQKLIINAAQPRDAAAASGESAAQPDTAADTAPADTTDPPSEEPSVQPPPNTKAVRHVVKSGDFLSSIATKYGVTFQDIMTWNHLNDTRLNIGQTLVIYVPADFETPEVSTSASEAARTEEPAASAGSASVENEAAVDTPQPTTAAPATETSAGGDTEIVYVVKRGDNLANIAAKYGVTAQDIREWNGIVGNRIDVNQQLKIRPKTMPSE